MIGVLSESADGGNASLFCFTSQMQYHVLNATNVKYFITESHREIIQGTCVMSRTR